MRHIYINALTSQAELLVSAGSFSPRDGTTITKEDVVMRQRDETKGTKMRKTQQQQQSLVRLPPLKQEHVHICSCSLETNSAPRWPFKETHPVAAANLCLLCKERGREGKCRCVAAGNI